jgi:hypothetical protein
MVSMLDLAVVLTLSIGMDVWLISGLKKFVVQCVLPLAKTLICFPLWMADAATPRIFPLPVDGQPGVPFKKGAKEGRARAVDPKMDLVLAVEEANFEILCWQKTVFSVIWLHLFLGAIWVVAMYVQCSALDSELYFATLGALSGVLVVTRHGAPRILRILLRSPGWCLLGLWCCATTSSVYMALSIAVFLCSVCGYLVCAGCFVAGAGSLVKRSVYHGHPLLFFSCFLPLVAAPYVAGSAEYTALEAWLLAAPPMPAPQVMAFMTAAGLGDVLLEDVSDPSNDVGAVDFLLITTLSFAGMNLFRIRKNILLKLNLVARTAGAASAAAASSTAPRPEPVIRVEAAVAAHTDPVVAVQVGLRNAPAAEGKSKFMVRMLKGGPNTVRGGDWGSEELSVEAGEDFYLKVTGAAVKKCKTLEDMEDFMSDCLDACLDFDPPFLGASATLSQVWNLSKSLGDTWAVAFFLDFVEKCNYRLDTSLLDMLYRRYTLKVARGNGGEEALKELRRELSRAHSRYDTLQHRINSTHADTADKISVLRKELKLPKRPPKGAKKDNRFVKPDPAVAAGSDGSEESG